MEGLMRRGVTAIAVKTVFIREFPPQVCAMAERTGTALLLYDGVYLEDVIAAVKGMLGQSAAFEKKDRLAARLAREQQPARCERLAQRLLGRGAAPGSVHGVRPSRGRRPPARGLRLRPRWEAACGGAAFRFGGMLVLLVCRRAGGHAARRPARGGSGHKRGSAACLCGRAMEESVRAARYAQAQGRLPADMRPWVRRPLCAAAQQDWYVQRFCSAWLGTLRSYDEKNATALYETALCYARCPWRCPRWRQSVCFSIRIRCATGMQKAKVLLCGEGAEDNAFYEQLYLCAFLHGDL